jgi:glutamine synthetase
VDGNQLMMETICTVARRHGMEALLHEKPFAGINGSGKHNNWSIGTIEADGSSVNLFDPGDDPSSNARFLLFAAAVIEAVDRYALLIRASTATAPNEHRLGANEAPPAIISIFFGQQLTDVFEAIARGETNGATGLPKKDKITLGVTSLPTLPKDISDRNRTSPFAFTGNKFEFRMCGSSQSIASPNMFINLTLAEVLGEYADALEELPRRAGKAERNAAIQSIVKEAYIKHSRVVFNGNGYSDEWVAEAEKRGLPNVKSAPEALEVLVTPETIALFEKHKVLTKEELESRYSIYLEKYSKQLNIETGISLEMTRRGIITAASKYLTEMSAAAVSMAQAGVAEYNAPQLKRVKAVAALISDVDKAADALDAVWDKAGEIEDELGQAKCYSNEVRPAMEQLRAKVDELEMMIPPKEWPFPGYEDILFKL